MHVSHGNRGEVSVPPLRDANVSTETDNIICLLKMLLCVLTRPLMVFWQVWHFFEPTLYCLPFRRPWKQRSGDQVYDSYMNC